MDQRLEPSYGGRSPRSVFAASTCMRSAMRSISWGVSATDIASGAAETDDVSLTLVYGYDSSPKFELRRNFASRSACAEDGATAGNIAVRYADCLVAACRCFRRRCMYNTSAKRTKSRPTTVTVIPTGTAAAWECCDGLSLTLGVAGLLETPGLVGAAEEAGVEGTTVAEVVAVVTEEPAADDNTADDSLPEGEEDTTKGRPPELEEEEIEGVRLAVVRSCGVDGGRSLPSSYKILISSTYRAVPLGCAVPVIVCSPSARFARCHTTPHAGAREYVATDVGAPPSSAISTCP